MPFVEGLHSFLAATAGITAITGDAPTRIYGGGIPQLDENEDFLASLVFVQAGRLDIDRLEEAGQRRTLFDFQSISEDHTEAHELNDALEAALSFYRGTMGDYTCNIAKLQDATDGIDVELGLYVVTSKYVIWHT